MKKEKPIIMEIPEDVIRQFEELPDVTTGRYFEWTDQRDELLLKYWDKKRKTDVCKLLGCSENTARRRYRELVTRKIKNI